MNLHHTQNIVVKGDSNQEIIDNREQENSVGFVRLNFLLSETQVRCLSSKHSNVQLPRTKEREEKHQSQCGAIWKRPMISCHRPAEAISRH